jgi:hypothetical protein
MRVAREEPIQEAFLYSQSDRTKDSEEQPRKMPFAFPSLLLVRPLCFRKRDKTARSGDTAQRFLEFFK